MQVDEESKQPANTVINTSGSDSKTLIKGESALLQLLIDYLEAESQTGFAFVAGDATTCSSDGQWLV